MFDENTVGQKSQGALTGFVLERSKLDAKLNGFLFLKKFQIFIIKADLCFALSTILTTATEQLTHYTNDHVLYIPQ